MDKRRKPLTAQDKTRPACFLRNRALPPAPIVRAARARLTHTTGAKPCGATVDKRRKALIGLHEKGPPKKQAAPRGAKQAATD
nr:hypothetical protein [Chromobacterium sp. ASV5]